MLCFDGCMGYGLFYKRKGKKQKGLVAIVKLASLVVCLIAFYSEFLMKNIITVNGAKNSYFNILLSSALLIAMILLSLFWLAFSVNIFKIRHVKIMEIFESFVFISIFSILIISSYSYISQYKFLFIFVIITSTLQSGMKYGMNISFVSSFIVLAIDIIFIPGILINTYFENDLIFAGVFIMIAWTLGHYVKIEDENLKMKNLQLQALVCH